MNSNLVSERRSKNISPEAPNNIAEAFLRTAERLETQTALVSMDGTVVLTWAEVREKVRRFAAGLASRGLQAGDTVAIMVKNRPEFFIADVSAMVNGAVPFSIYATLPAVQISPILENSDTRVVICEEAFLDTVLNAVEQVQRDIQIILIEGDKGDCIGWDRIEEEGEHTAFDLWQRAAAISGDDVAAMVYTSGTTGDAKGVEIPHSSLVGMGSITKKIYPLEETDRYLSWLPTASMAERATNLYLPLVFGGTIYFCDDTNRVTEVLPRARPHLFFGPPRFWEKVREALEASWLTQSEEVHDGLDQAFALHRQRMQLELSHQPVPEELRERCAESDRRYFAPIRERFGFTDGHFVPMSGGAPAPNVLLEFFYCIGVPLQEVYGLTESCTLGTRNLSTAMKLGSIGRPADGMEVKLADDSEILIRAPGMMRGYRKMPELTAEAIDAEGWLHTGDLGAVDDEGYFRVVGRKKDMIINSFGKNMSPVNIENALVSSGPFIESAMVVGDQRKYNTAVLVLNAAHLEAWAQERGLPQDAGVEALAQHPLVFEQVTAEVEEGNSKLARVEQIKKFVVIGTAWPSDALTPIMKLKRNVIEEKFALQIEALYNS